MTDGLLFGRSPPVVQAVASNAWFAGTQRFADTTRRDDFQTGTVAFWRARFQLSAL